ncbi:Spore germination protein [Alicyclobacillus hesperidum]|uniref:Spore germination protein n=1 Tax=Alicyclobacillus hesperidum TaxID=89784 RepID=A0A1H2ULA6_9BACL|nr:endospore germination permease [Alicyclobacillus hesperidum]SDW56840.1 Spore germination protein [Alicyclobacillus hesperidum]
MAMHAAQTQTGGTNTTGGEGQSQGQTQGKTQTTISLLQYFMVVIASITAFGHFVYVHLAMMYAGRDTWLSLTLGCLIGLMITYLSLVHVAKYPKLSLAGLMQAAFGRWVGGAITSLYVVYFLFLVALTLKLVAGFMTVIYPTTPSVAFVFSVLAVGAWACTKGIEVLTRTMQIILPFLIAMGVGASLLSIKDKDFTDLLPILYHGWPPVFAGSLIFIAMFAEMIVFRTFTPHVQSPEKLPRYGILLTGIIWAMFLLPCIGPIVLFGETIAKSLAFPTYTEIQYIQIQNIIERFDIFGVLLWTNGSFFRIAAYLYGATSSLGELVGENATTFAVPAAMLAGGAALCMLPTSREEIYHYMSTSYIWLSLAAGMGIPLLAAGMMSIRKLVNKSNAGGQKGGSGKQQKHNSGSDNRRRSGGRSPRGVVE